MGREAPAVLSLLVGALLLAPTPLRADPDPDPAPSSTRAPLELFVNGVDRGSVLVILRDGDVLVDPADLERGGIAGITGRGEMVRDVAWLSLSSVRPALRWRVDERALALRIDAPGEALKNDVVDLRPSPRLEGLAVRSDASGFLNYAATMRTDGRASGFAEVGASAGTALLYSGLSRDFDGAFVRGLSRLTFDEPQELRRWTAGDTLVASDALGGATLVGGVSVAREFSLDPYFIRAPMPRTTAVALTPSILDIYVNGVLVREQQLPPGTYQLQNLPVTTGAGSVRAVVRDAFGRTEELDSRYYFSSGLLSKGLSDYAYQVGFRREEYGIQSFSYGEPAFLARHRLGLADAVTAGLRLEGSRSGISGGPTVTVALAYGELELGLAASTDDRRPGAAGSLGYAYVSRVLSGGAYVRGRSASYGNVSLRADDDRAVLEGGAYLAFPVSKRATLRLDTSASRYRDAAGPSGLVTLGLDTQVASALGLSLRGSLGGASNALPITAPTTGFFAMLTYALEPRTTGNVAFNRRDDGRVGSSVGLQRALPLGTGYGYRLQADATGPGAVGIGQLQVQGPHGRYEIDYSRTGGADVGSATAAGGVVLIDRSLFLTRPVEQGFGLVQVPGVEGVRGFLENQEVGRTDSHGNLLVPNLLPYYGNRLSIAPVDIPLGYQIGAVQQLVAPPQRGGVVTRFAVLPIQSFTGKVLVRGDAAPPAYGELTLAGDRRFSSPLDASGQFYLENVPPGSYRAKVEHERGECDVDVTIPQEATSRVELGTVLCTPVLTASPVVSPVPARPATATPSATTTATTTSAASSTPTATATAANRPPAPTAIAKASPKAKPKKLPRAKGAGSRDGFEALFCGPGKVWICRGKPSPGSGWPASRCCVPSSSGSQRLKSGKNALDRHGREPEMFLVEPRRRRSWPEYP